MSNMVLRGFLANVEVFPPLIMTFQLNPSSVKDNKAVSYEPERTGVTHPSPGKRYTGAGDRTIVFSIHLDGLEQGSNLVNPLGLDNGISTELAKLRSFLYPEADAWALIAALGGDEEGMRVSSPPRCYFGFGTRILECVVTQIEINETQFNAWLAPVRADATITLVVIEESANLLYEADKIHRNVLAALGLLNISPI